MDLNMFSQEVLSAFVHAEAQKEVSNLLVSALLFLKIHVWLLLWCFFFLFFLFPLTRIYALGVIQRQKYFIWKFLLWVHSPAH